MTGKTNDKTPTKGKFFAAKGADKAAASDGAPNGAPRDGSRRLDTPAAVRNREPILAVLERVLPDRGLVLEVASGTGQHAAHFAPRFPGLDWQPTDPDPLMRDSIAAWGVEGGRRIFRPPLDLDVASDPWPVSQAAAVLCINMIHISPWACTQGLMRGSGRVLIEGGVLYLYGPYRIGGRPTAESNAAFDASLKSRDPQWGVRDLEAVCDLAAEHGLKLAETVDMPANNLSVIFKKS